MSCATAEAPRAHSSVALPFLDKGVDTFAPSCRVQIWPTHHDLALRLRRSTRRTIVPTLSRVGQKETTTKGPTEQGLEIQNSALIKVTWVTLGPIIHGSKAIPYFHPFYFFLSNCGPTIYHTIEPVFSFFK